MSVLRKIFSFVSRKPEQALRNEALCKAATKGDLPGVRRLLDAGAEVDCLDAEGLTPLYHAATHNFNDICRLLLERGADPNPGKPGDLEGTALTQAAYRGFLDVVKTLVEFKADLNLRGYEQRTALHEAIWRSSAEIAVFLIEAGADTTGRSRMGGTPFHDAIANGMHGTAMVLARHGADVDATDDRGITVREKATEKGWSDLADAADQYKRDQEQAKARAAAEEQQKQEAFAAEIRDVPILQSDMVVKRPLSFRRVR
jgi:ankyrin repeat protein